MAGISDAALRRLAVAAFLVVAGLTAVTFPLVDGLDGNPAIAHGGDYQFDLGFVVNGSILAVTALVLCLARPRNPVGWFLGLGAVFGSLCNAGSAYGTRALVVEGSDLPLGALALSWSSPLWMLSLATPATLVLSRYPDGRLAGRWARRRERLVLVLFATLWFGYSTIPNSVTDAVPSVQPPLVLPAVGGTLLVGSALGLLGCILVTVAETVRRAWRASWPERPQLVLLLVAAPATVATVMLVEARWIGSLVFALLPLAVVVGVLRYRLLGIEVVVRRTLVYALLTALVAVVVVASASVVAAAVPEGPLPQVVAASLVAVGLVPVRDRLQRAVDRLLYGDRADPWAALGRLGREAADGDSLTDVVAAVAQGLRLPGAEVRGSDGTTAAYGDLGDQPVHLPLVVGDKPVGELLVAPRRGERSLGAADDRLLTALAPLVALVLRDTTMTAALLGQQERVAQATHAERARLRRDLHDGLGPSLTGVGLGLEAIDTEALPDRSRAVVARLRSEVAASLEEVRRIIDDLRPGALESGDLLSLLRGRAADLSARTPLRVEVVAPPALPPLPLEVETAALRIADEALTNVVRHARATVCIVTVSVDDALRLEVVDDGVGFTAPRPGGVGLSSMRSRAASLGGRLQVESPGTGTRVVAELPVGVPA
jgi:two-component system NarL family sensor kinase